MDAMSLAVVNARASLGLDAPPVAVEVHITGGLPQLAIVGLPETAVKESKDRVRSALMNACFEYPRKRITVNLAPADLPKDGGRFDLPIAVGILAASEQLPLAALSDHEFIGELALGGALRRVGRTLTAALKARDADRRLVLPYEDAAEAALVRNATVLPAKDLLEVCGHLTGAQPISPQEAPRAPEDLPPEHEDLTDVKGQYRAKRALEIAAAGAHNLLLIGPPGTGKTMLATRLPGILPPMEENEALESAAAWSVSSLNFAPERWGRRPFRAPHHTASAVALVGGGTQPRPGEASLAHNGVLFLDELPEFDRRALETLREPMESGSITISRAARQADFPARFQLVAAMNPCPCGHLGDASRACRCTSDQIHRYRARISGPLLDRIDLHVEMPRPKPAIAAGAVSRLPESTAEVAARVQAARARQYARAGAANTWLSPKNVELVCGLDAKDRRLLDAAIVRFGLSERARHRILRVARTIADLAGETRVCAAHLSEAVSLRVLDRSDQSRTTLHSGQN
jgi:magnesium chelatase family protein